MIINYFDALAGAGKTRALARYADRLARRGFKVIFTQPTKHLIEMTIQDELRPLDPSYPIRAIHGASDAGRVVPEIVAHLKQAQPGGEVLFITHAALFRLPSYIERKGDWHLLVDEIPQVDLFEELDLPETHGLITDHLIMEPYDALYGRLHAKEDAR